MKSGLWLPLLVLTSLAGCGGGEGLGDLDAYMNEARMRPPREIEPIPALGSYPAFTYNAASRRSPFQASVRADLLAARQGEQGVKPDPGRSKQFLEGFSIEQFEMVGSISNASASFALIRGAGAVHRLKVGDYLGRNDGRIVAISESQIEVLEIVPDGAGAWLGRPRTILLKEHI